MVGGNEGRWRAVLCVSMEINRWMVAMPHRDGQRQHRGKEEFPCEFAKCAVLVGCLGREFWKTFRYVGLQHGTEKWPS